MKKDTGKATVDLLLATKAIVERDLDLGIVTKERLRYRVIADDRKKLAKELASKGVSQRKIAAFTGAGQSTIRDDLREQNHSRTEWNHSPTKAQRRATREAELAAKQCALPDKKYGVIVADPEWRFEPYSRETGMDRAADNHYPTSATEIIADRDVGSIAADDCVLFLWATVPMLLAALDVMKAWGFEYRSHVTWDKIHIGTGFWFRNRHELLLVGTRGDVPAPAMGTQFPSVIAIARKEHSEKPEQFLELIEEYFPTLPKIELNRRGAARSGWDAWGNESEKTRHIDKILSSSSESQNKKRKKVSICENWSPNVAGRELAKQQGWNEHKIKLEIHRFSDHARQHDRKYADWEAAWRNWVTSPYQQKANGNGARLSNSEVADRLIAKAEASERGFDFSDGDNGGIDSGQSGQAIDRTMAPRKTG